MADPETRPDDAAALEASLADLGRRISDAKADADRRAAAPPSRPFPVLWVAALVLVIAMIAGGLALAATGGDDDDQVAGAGAPGTETTLATPETTVAATGTTVAEAAPETTVAEAAPETTVAEAASASPEAAPGITVAAPTPPGDPPAAGRANAPNQTVREITVLVGESFWSIAEREVGAQLGRPATDGEVTGWWADLVAANADRLVEPGNPNLILPGQVLVAPVGAA